MNDQTQNKQHNKKTSWLTNKSKEVKDITNNLKDSLDNFLSIYKSIKKIFFGTVTAVVFLGDTLKPLLNFIPYILGLGALLLIGGMIILLSKKSQKTAITALAIAFIFFVLAIFFTITPYQGVLASLSNKVSDAQVSVAENVLNNQDKAKVIKIKQEMRDIATKNNQGNIPIDSDIMEMAQEIDKIDPDILEQSQFIKDVEVQKAEQINAQYIDKFLSEKNIEEIKEIENQVRIDAKPEPEPHRLELDIHNNRNPQIRGGKIHQRFERR